MNVNAPGPGRDRVFGAQHATEVRRELVVLAGIVAVAGNWRAIVVHGGADATGGNRQVVVALAVVLGPREVEHGHRGLQRQRIERAPAALEFDAAHFGTAVAHVEADAAVEGAGLQVLVVGVERRDAAFGAAALLVLLMPNS